MFLFENLIFSFIENEDEGRGIYQKINLNIELLRLMFTTNIPLFPTIN